MKKTVFIGMLAMLPVILTLSSCNKSSQTPDESNNTGTAGINLMIEQSFFWIDSNEVRSDELSGDIYIANYGLAPDFLIDQSYLDPGQGTGDSTRIHIRDHSLIRCIKLLGLSDTQHARVRKELQAYKDCKEHATMRVKEIYNELHEKYREEFKQLLQALKNGRITREEFNRKVAVLKKEFRAELKDLMLKEKLNIALKTCLRSFFKELRVILNDRQWNAFRECFLH